MKHGYIAPINYLDMIPANADFHLTLIHLFENKAYADFYKKKKDRGDFIIVDNSAFEYGEALTKEFLLSTLEKLSFIPDVIVLPDYPNKDYNITVESAYESAKFFQKNYSSICSYMVVPQSEEGDVVGWIKGYEDLCKVPNVSFIGLSILGIPNAFSSLTGTDDISFNRMFALAYLQNNNIVDSNIKHHCLGLGSNVRELLFMAQFPFVYSNDSSSAVWHGIQGVRYDSTVTGLFSGKSKKSVDFFIERLDSNVQDIKYNINFIEFLITNK